MPPQDADAVGADGGSHADAVSSVEAVPRALRRNGMLRLVALAAIWGCSFLFIKVGDEVLAPLQVAFGRVLCGALVLMVPVLAGRVRLPRRRRVWAHLAVVAVMFNTVPFALFAYGEQRITSVAAGIWNALTPLVTFPLAVVFLGDTRFTRTRSAGVGLGFLGVLVVLGVWSGLGGRNFVGDAECIAAAACYGMGFVYTRRFLVGGEDGPLSLACGQLLLATLELGLLAVPLTSAPHHLPLRVAGSIVALGGLGTGIAYAINYGLIAEVGAAVTSTVTYLVPVFSTVLGVAVVGEALRWNQPVGAALIVGGAVLVRVEPSRSPPVAEAPHRLPEDG